MLRRTRIALLLTVFSAALLAPRPGLGQEATLEDRPAPDSVEGLHGALSGALEEPEPERTAFPWLKRKLRDLPPFLRDTEIRVKPRTYYFDRSNGNDPRARAWALGGSLTYASGYFEDVFAIGGALYTTQRLIGKDSEDGTLLLKEGQQGFTVLGQAYAVLKLRDHHATLYRQQLDLPYVNKQDSRMVPNTFEGYTATGQFWDVWKLEKLEYIGGYLDRIKLRERDEFIGMSKAAGVPGSSKGMFFGGARITPWDGFTLGGLDYFVDDTLNTAYAEVDYTRKLTEALALRLGGQFTHQSSAGSNDLTGSSFATWVLGGQIAASYKGFILRTAFSTVDDRERIRSPFGSYPGYLAMMQSDFRRAGEDAWLVGASYDFRRFGLPGLSFFTNFAQGTGRRDPSTGAPLPDRRSFDVTVDYQRNEGPLRGFWLRVRASLLDTDGQQNSTDVRVILNYSVPVL